MAKRKLRPRGGTGKSAKKDTNSADQFVIPSLLKTEQIMVEDIIKPEIDPPCTDSRSSENTGISDNTIYYTCGGCGVSGVHHLGLEYRLVRTATLVEVGSQTGDASEIQVKASGMIASEVGVLDDAMERSNHNNPVSVPISSATSPIVVSSDNGKRQTTFNFISFLFFDVKQDQEPINPNVLLEVLTLLFYFQKILQKMRIALTQMKRILHANLVVRKRLAAPKMT